MPNIKKNCISAVPFTLLLKLAVIRITDRFTPLIGSFHAWHFNGKMGHPAVSGSTMPVLDSRGNSDHRARFQLYGILSPFLIPAGSPDTDQDLAAALLCMMDMPVVAAARLKRYIIDCKRLLTDR